MAKMELVVVSISVDLFVGTQKSLTKILNKREPSIDP